jgi:hypothetical protein
LSLPGLNHGMPIFALQGSSVLLGKITRFFRRSIRQADLRRGRQILMLLPAFRKPDNTGPAPKLICQNLTPIPILIP